ncbi:MAG: CPBP family intramembrane metalloprotease [Verrucomicrobia bacterium]|nr:CPBP family intramembrane metalloprotease [Verrucomicrobiota bacterium]
MRQDPIACLRGSAKSRPGSRHSMQGPVAVGLTTLLGFGLGVIMVLHRSIWPAVIAHGMFDATSLALLPGCSNFL